MHVDWNSLLGHLLVMGGAAHVSLLEKVLRPAVVYLLLAFGLRVFGRRVLGQFTTFDLVLLLLISNTVQNAIIGPDDSLTGGIVGAAALFAVNEVLVAYFYRHRGSRLERLMLEEDVYLIRDGRLNEPVLQRLRIGAAELTAKAHERGFDSLDQVADAVLYPNGTVYMRGRDPMAGRLDGIAAELRALRQDMARLARDGD